MIRAPLLPWRIRCQVVSTPQPSGETMPRPVTTTRLMFVSPDPTSCAAGGLATVSCTSGHCCNNLPAHDQACESYAGGDQQQPLRRRQQQETGRPHVTDRPVSRDSCLERQL